jgi:7,8-dihydropterin-6-yl-methyl-4-(beta-D-ribofuranosyl)aminobenzene 5'-phosphate synthase
MNAKILNLYDSKVCAGKKLTADFGSAFHITIGENQVLLDLGSSGEVLANNAQSLGIDFNNVSKVVLSHAHADHTGGLPALLKGRAESIGIIAHPNVLENKTLSKNGSQVPIGLPFIASELASKATFRLSAEPVEIAPNLYTTGEIPLSQRTEKPGVASRARHKVAGAYEWDPVIDDLSLVLVTKNGLVLITGCCHAGVLNVCRKAKSLFNKKIAAVIGGTHMAEYTPQEVAHVADVLESDYDSPELYLCHCTGNKAIAQLKEKFGAYKVHYFPAGTEKQFELI